MILIDSSNAKGEVVQLVQTNENHLDSRGEKKGLNMEKGHENFRDLLSLAIGKVSDGQLRAESLFRRMITNPDEVEPHDVTIAMAQASMSLNLTKTILDRAVKAYNDITTMR